jgi:hypothetical protein
MERWHMPKATDEVTSETELLGRMAGDATVIAMASIAVSWQHRLAVQQRISGAVISIARWTT